MAQLHENSLDCPVGLHGRLNEESLSQVPFLFDELKSDKQCCELKNRIAKTIEDLKSSLPKISSRNEKERSIESYYRSTYLNNACKLAFIASDSEQCAHIMEFQDQTRFRKNNKPLRLGTHLLRWPIYRRRLHAFFYWESESQNMVSSPMTIEDPISTIIFPNKIVNWPVDYVAPSTVLPNSKISDFQFNLVVITRGTFNLWRWHQELLNQLINHKKFGKCGQNHRLIFPLVFSEKAGLPNFVSEEMLKYCFVLSKTGFYVGDLALKLILPIVFVVNELLINSNNELSEYLTNLPEALPFSDITEYVFGFYDLFNTSIHLVTYPALDTAFFRHYKNTQLFQGVQNLVLSLSKCATILFSKAALLLLNSELSISGVPKSLKTSCTVDNRCSLLFKYSSVEGLLNCGFRWVGNHFCEAFIDTNLSENRKTVKAAIDYLIAYFQIFLADCDFEINIDQYQITKLTFDRNQNLYQKQTVNLDKALGNLDSSQLAIPVQCLSTDAFRFVQIMFDFTPIEGIEVNGKRTLFIVFLKMCLNRIFSIANYSEDIEKPECIPAYPFKRWLTVSEKDRFGNDVVRFVNPFQPLYSILRPAQFWLRANKNELDFENLMPLYCEVIFQLFNPVANAAIRIGNDPEGIFNCRDLLEWVIKIGNFMQRKNQYDAAMFSDKRFFAILKSYWSGFVLDKQWGILLGEKAKAIASTKIIGHFGALVFEGNLEPQKLNRPEYEFGGSYADPIFEALHMQMSMLLFSPSKISDRQFLCHLTRFACCAHPLTPLNLQCSPLMYLGLINEETDGYFQRDTLRIDKAKSIENIKSIYKQYRPGKDKYIAFSKNLLDSLLIYISEPEQSANGNRFIADLREVHHQDSSTLSLASSEATSSFSLVSVPPDHERDEYLTLTIPTPEQIQQLNRILCFVAPVNFNTLEQNAYRMSSLSSDSFEVIGIEEDEDHQNKKAVAVPRLLSSQSCPGAIVFRNNEEA